MPIKMKPKAPTAKMAGATTTRNTSKAMVLGNLVADKTGRSSSNDAGLPRPEQQLMNESLQVPHPFEKGKSLGWGEFKGLAKTQATKFRDMGITNVPAYQQKAYDTALGGLEKFPEQAVANYQDARVAERIKIAISGAPKKVATGRVVSGGTAVYKKGTSSIKMSKKKC